MHDLHYVFETPYRGQGSAPLPAVSQQEAVAYLDAGLREAFRRCLGSPERLGHLIGTSLPIQTEGDGPYAATTLDTKALSPTQYDRLVAYLAARIHDAVRQAAVFNAPLLLALRSLGIGFDTGYVTGILRQVPLPSAAADPERNAPQGDTAALQALVRSEPVPTHGDQALGALLVEQADPETLRRAGRTIAGFRKGEDARGYVALRELQKHLHEKGASRPSELARWLLKSLLDREDELRPYLVPTPGEVRYERLLREQGQKIAEKALTLAAAPQEEDGKLLAHLAKSDTPCPDGDWVGIQDVEDFCSGCATYMREKGMKSVPLDRVAKALDREIAGWGDPQWEGILKGLTEMGVPLPTPEQTMAEVTEELRKARGKVRSKITGKLVSRQRHLAGRAGMSGWAEKMKKEAGAHPFTACTEKMAKHIGMDAAKKFCARVHIMAFGMTPRQRSTRATARKGEPLGWRGSGGGYPLGRVVDPRPLLTR